MLSKAKGPGNERPGFPISIFKHYGFNVLRDDLLPGGTKSVLIPSLTYPWKKEYVYASPVYGGFQIALATALKSKAIIFCAGRKDIHPNTQRCLNLGAKVVPIYPGYLSVVSNRAESYVAESPTTRQLIPFGGRTFESENALRQRVKDVVTFLEKEPKYIVVAVGSGFLFESILAATKKTIVIGVKVGAEYDNNHRRASLYRYPKPFESLSKYRAPFPSSPNYDLKAFETMMELKAKGRIKGDILFWNVL